MLALIGIFVTRNMIQNWNANIFRREVILLQEYIFEYLKGSQFRITNVMNRSKMVIISFNVIYTFIHVIYFDWFFYSFISFGLEVKEHTSQGSI